jgi:dTDP-glucose 4,6-dehydratase
LKNVLVTGGCGFIGSNFVEYLATRDEYHIVVLDKLTYAGNLKNLEVVNSLKYTFINGDICNKKVLNELFEKYKFFAVIHFAAESHVDRSINDPIYFIKNNINSATNLFYAYLKYFKKKKIKLFHISTDEVYGSILKGEFKENDPYDPSSPYSASKGSADLIATSFNKTYGTKIKILNLTNNYGPYQFPEKFIPTLISYFLKNKKAPIYGKGTNVREWMYVI